MEDELAKRRAAKQANNVVNLRGEDGYQFDWAAMDLPPNPYVRQNIILHLEQRMGGEYIGWKLGMTNWIPEWHTYLHSKPEISTSRVEKVGPVEYVHCTPRDWLHLVE